jgi:hypothetical protein
MAASDKICAGQHVTAEAAAEAAEAEAWCVAAAAMTM